MKEHVRLMMELIGLPRNEVQVFEDTETSGTVMYPNYFTSVDYFGNYSDIDLLEIIEDMMIEHLKTVQKELQLLQTYKRTWYGDEQEGAVV